jgi:hypothetical protein
VIVTALLRRLATALIIVLAAFAAATPARAEDEHEEAGEESAELGEALASFFGPRAAPATRIASGAFAAATTTADDIPSTAGQWSELGPYSYFPDDPRYVDPCCSNSGSGSGYNTGRMTGIAVAPDGSVYGSGAGGGVWRTTDGQDWTPVFDDQQTTATGTIAVVVGGGAADYTVYVGTGEPTINLDSYAGVGVLRSTDHGATWQRVGGDELVGAAIYKIVPDEKGGLWAATSHGLYQLVAGAWVARVGGEDEQTGTPNAQVLNLFSDVAVRPGTGGDEVVAVRGWRAGAATNGLYASHDGGQTFEGPLAPTGYVPQNAQGRASIAYSSDGSKLYAIVEDPVAFNHTGGGTELEGVYLSTHDVEGPFTQIASPEVLMNSGSAQKPGAIGPGYKPGVQAWYNQFLIVDPEDGDHAYVGLEEVYETTDAGKTWTAAAPYWNLTLPCFEVDAPDFGGCPNTTHSDQHAAAIANGTLWIANDGGVFSRATSVHGAGGGWFDHNKKLGTLQYYYADSGKLPAGGPNGGKTVLWGGLQDNGTSKLIEGASLFAPIEASEPFGGDGGATVVKADNADVTLTEYTNLSPAITHDGGAHWTDVTPADPLPLFIAPVVQDGSTTDLYAGGEYLWRARDGFDTEDGEGWEQQFDTGPGHSITALALTSGKGYAAWCGPCWPGYVSETGFDRGLITNLGSGEWHQLDLTAVPQGCDAVPARYLTGVAVDPADQRHAYLSVSGYARHWMVGPDDPGVGHVFVTSDGGTCWHDISGDLVDAPANDVAIAGNRLVVADDVGVFVSGLSGGSWKRVGAGLPHTIVADLDTTPDGRLLAATHGRGLWTTPLASLGGSGTAATGGSGTAATGGSGTAATGGSTTASDTVAPRVDRLRLRRARVVRMRLSEAATVRLRIARQHHGARVIARAAEAGGVRIALAHRLRSGRYTLRAVAIDAAGNRSAAVSVRVTVPAA